MIDAPGARGVRRAAERFKCPHCRQRFPIGSQVVFYPDPEWVWGCRQCGQMWVDVLSSASASTSGIPLDVDLGAGIPVGEPDSRPFGPEADRIPLAYDAAPDVDDPAD
jgi:hypothetical protein